jgi:hypothetical protein
MPAAIEKDLTHAEQMFTGWWDYTNHFVPPLRLISSPWRFDYNQFPSTGQTMPLEIGPVLAALSAVACVMLWMKRRDLRGQQRVLSVAAAGAVLFSLLMCTTLSAPLWSLPGPLRLLQFPWRFLITASSAAALLAAAVVAGFGRRATASRIAAVVIVGALAALGLPHARAGSYLQWKAEDFQGTGLRQQGLDLTSLGEFRPMTAVVAPASFVREAAVLTKGAGTIAETDHHASRRVFRINAATSSTIQLNVLYFRGWTARIDGTPLTIRPSTSTGLIELDASAGAHDIEIRFENTPVRTIANTLSAGALLGSLVLMLFGARQLHREDRDRSE